MVLAQHGGYGDTAYAKFRDRPADRFTVDGNKMENSWVLPQKGASLSLQSLRHHLALYITSRSMKKLLNVAVGQG